MIDVWDELADEILALQGIHTLLLWAGTGSESFFVDPDQISNIASLVRYVNQELERKTNALQKQVDKLEKEKAA